MGPSYVLSTPFIPGAQPDHLYTLLTPVIPGIPDDDPTRYTLSTPTIPGVELPLDAGPDHLDETYLRTTLSPPSISDHMDETYLPTTLSLQYDDHLDETYEPTTLTVCETVLVSPITFFPARRKSTVQALAVLLDPGADQTVIFPRLPYQAGRLGVVN
jgi:hypothetical protein